MRKLRPMELAHFCVALSTLVLSIATLQASCATEKLSSDTFELAEATKANAITTEAAVESFNRHITQITDGVTDGIASEATAVSLHFSGDEVLRVTDGSQTLSGFANNFSINATLENRGSYRIECEVIVILEDSAGKYECKSEQSLMLAPEEVDSISVSLDDCKPPIPQGKDTFAVHLNSNC